MSVNPTQHGTNVPPLAIQTNPAEEQIQVPPGISTSPRVLKSEHGQETILVKVRPESSNLLSPPHANNASRPNSGFTDADEDYNHALHIFPEVIGRGKFGEVFRAQLDDTCGTVLAVKRVKISSAMPERTRIKCFNEVALLKSLSHPHIVGCLDAFFDPLSQELVIVLEMVPGGDLKDMVRTLAAKKRRFTEKRLWVTLRDLSSALHYMHAKRILHRDLKSANVLMGKEGSVKLADFGLGRLVAGDGTLEAVSKVGTPLYMPPEILRGEKYGSKADVYSLGCIMYEMVRFATPFQHCTEQRMSMVQLFECIKAGAFAPLAPAQCKYSPLLCDTIMAMLSGDPARRPTTRALLGLSSVVAAQVSAGLPTPSAQEAQAMVADWERDTRAKEEEEARLRAEADAEQRAAEEAQVRDLAAALSSQAGTEALARSCGVRVLEGASAQRLQQSLRANGLAEGVVLVDQTGMGPGHNDGLGVENYSRLPGTGDVGMAHNEGAAGAFEEYYPVETEKLMAGGMKKLAITPSFGPTPAHTPAATPAKPARDSNAAPQSSSLASPQKPQQEDQHAHHPNAIGAHEPRTQQPLTTLPAPSSTAANTTTTSANNALPVKSQIPTNSHGIPLYSTVQPVSTSTYTTQADPSTQASLAPHPPTPTNVRLAFASVDPGQPPTPAHNTYAAATGTAGATTASATPSDPNAAQRPSTRPRLASRGDQQPPQPQQSQTQQQQQQQPVTATNYIRQILTARQAALGATTQAPGQSTTAATAPAAAAATGAGAGAAMGGAELPSSRAFVAVTDPDSPTHGVDSHFFNTPRKPTLNSPHSVPVQLSRSGALHSQHSTPHSQAPVPSSTDPYHQTGAAPGLSHLNTALQRQTVAPLRLPGNAQGATPASSARGANDTNLTVVPPATIRPRSSHLPGYGPDASGNSQGQNAPSLPSLRVSLRQPFRIGDPGLGNNASAGATRGQAQSQGDAPGLTTARPVPRVSLTPSRVGSHSAPAHNLNGSGFLGTGTINPSGVGQSMSGVGAAGAAGPMVPQGMLAPLQQTPRQHRVPQPPATAPPLNRFSRRVRNNGQ